MRPVGAVIHGAFVHGTMVAPGRAMLSTKIVRNLGIAVTLFAWAFFGSPGLLLLVSAETLSGRLAGLLAFVTPGWLLGMRTFPFLQRRASVIGLAIFLGSGLLTLVQSEPNMEVLGNGNVRSVHAPGRRPAWWAPARLVPEVDQLLFGSYLAQWTDPLIDQSEAQDLRAAILSVYRPLLADERFEALGSVLGDALLDNATGHRFEYVPAHAPDERLAAVILLHGSLGNWTGYFAQMVAFAEKAHVVVVAPSFGFGMWSRQGGLRTIEATRQHMVTNLPVDPERIALVGISNGALGVSFAGLVHGEKYRSLAYLSGVLDQSVVGPERFAETWEGKPVLVVHGTDDPRISEPTVAGAVRAMSRAGARVTYERIPGASHWLVFSHAGRVREVFGRWWREAMEQNRTPGLPSATKVL